MRPRLELSDSQTTHSVLKSLEQEPHPPPNSPVRPQIPQPRARQLQSEPTSSKWHRTLVKQSQKLRQMISEGTVKCDSKHYSIESQLVKTFKSPSDGQTRSQTRGHRRGLINTPLQVLYFTNTSSKMQIC